LPSRWGLLEIAPANIVLSALKPGKNGSLIARVYEAGGQSATNSTLRLHAKIRSAREVNLMEDPGSKLNVRDNSIRLDFHPFEIKSCEFQLAQPILTSAKPSK
jgi:alpha-mannosidase